MAPVLCVLWGCCVRPLRVGWREINENNEQFSSIK